MGCVWAVWNWAKLWSVVGYEADLIFVWFGWGFANKVKMMFSWLTIYVLQVARERAHSKVFVAH